MEEKNKEEYQYDNGFHPKEVVLPLDYKLFREDFLYKLINKLLVYTVKLGYFFPKYLVWGFRVRGKENKKHLKGSVIVSNHVHQLDATMTFQAHPLTRFYITTLESNLGFGWISKVFRGAGIVPIPTNPRLLKRLYKEAPEIVKKGNSIIVYPEGSLVPYSNRVRDFKQGAFRLALACESKIVPIVYTFHKTRGLYRLTSKNKPSIHQNILPPYYVRDMGNKKLTIDTAMEEVHKIMSDYFNENSDYFKK